MQAHRLWKWLFQWKKNTIDKSYGLAIQYIKKRCNLLNLNSKVEINGINYTNKKEKRSINFNTNHFIKNCYSNINTKGIFNSVKEGSIIGKINVKKNCFNTKAFFHYSFENLYKLLF